MIIGITGTLAAGKGTIVEFLKEKGFKHYSARELITEEIKKRKLEINRDNMVLVANDLRKQFGPSYVIEKLYEKAKEDKTNAVIESIRCVGEIEHLRQVGNFILLSVNANQNIRYKRATLRQSETDKVTFEKFIEQEKTEMNSNDKFKQNLSACINLSDIKIENNGTLDELKQKLDEALKNARK